MGVFETPRFRIALVEHNNQRKHVVMDKKDKKTHVFQTFEEGIILHPYFYMKHDYVIDCYPCIHYNHITDERRQQMKSFYSDFPDEYFDRYNFTFNPEILSEADQKILNNHDEMTDNPVLVVYKFRE